MDVKVNQEMIARELKLSVGTVSKSLRNSPEIHPNTRAQVVAMARRLSYRGPASRIDKQTDRETAVRSFCLLLQSDSRVGDDQRLQNASHVLAGMTEAAHALNASVTVHYVPLAERDHINDPRHQPVALRQNLLSGLVLQNYYPAHIIKALAAQLPCVTISRLAAAQPVDSVDLDPSDAMRTTVSHLFSLGHRRIGFLSGFATQAWHQERYGSYVQALISLDLAFDPAIADPRADVFEDGGRLTEQVVRQTRSGVTAWVTASDSVGYEWCRRFRDSGLEPGRDVSITGVDGARPPDGVARLTSVRVPFDAMGRATIQLLTERIREPVGPLRRLCLEGTLISGESTAPPRAG